ncbi:torsin-like protein [Drosophila guanche]|uniref:Blast:Torsin-like protein n=1 Tax=Drosophila guanche TaxID=7266 RepID=A0A3B0JQF0_DROGU|nr:torsin-like protein [Drosophila guanche]SPP77680.1 blast:Torsin-like protein [Drosophila guanche]
MYAISSTKSLILLLGLLLYCIHDCHSIEPLTIGAAIGIGSIGLNYFKGQTYCRFYECCDDRSIPGNITALHRSLESTLYGQHIVTQHLIPALSAHLSAQSKSRKPLVLSFHGQPGTGKNFVANQIAQALYLDGSNSAYVTKFLGRSDFPLADLVDQYKVRIDGLVRDRLRSCPRSLFIFDEVDKMPSGVFDTLASLVDYNAFTDGTDHTKAIFIFLSNTAGTHIADHLGNSMKAGKLREDTLLSDYESLLQRAAYNLDGGMKKTGLIEAHVIDHYIPFLPMEKAHVVQCLEAEFRRWGKQPDKDIINEILSSSISYDRMHGLFVSSGCKTLEKKVAMAIY